MGLFDNGGFLGVASDYDAAPSGVWDLTTPFLRKRAALGEQVLLDDFETFSGWTTVSSGVVSQSSAQAYQGTFSAIKTTNNDPNGAYKLLSSPVYREFVLEAWIYSVEPRAGGGADRLAIVNSSGDGYGFNSSSGTLRSEIRNSYTGTNFSSTDATWTRPANAWYRVVMTALANNTFTVNAYNTSGSLLAAHTSIADTTHIGPFDRVAILGGNEFHVDNLTVTRMGL